MEREQAFGDHETLRVEVLGRAEGAVPVLVDRLHDRLVCPQVLEVLREDVEVVAVGVERRDVALGPLLAVVAVVVVGAEVRDLVLAEDAHDPRVIVVLPEPESPTMPSMIGRGMNAPGADGTDRGWVSADKRAP